MESLLSIDYFILFSIVALGLAVGNLKVKGFSLGSSAVVIVALFVGYVYSIFNKEIKIPSIIQNVGLILFIYTIGIQSGPSFFKSLRSDGLKFILLALFPSIIGGVLVFTITKLSGIDSSIIIGIFTGSMTSTPGLAAAKDITGSDLASIGYSISYPFGVVGIIIFIKLIPKIFKVDIKEEEEKYKKMIFDKSPKLLSKKFVVENREIIGKNLITLDFRSKTGCNVSSILKKNKDELSSVMPTSVLNEGDILTVIGTKVSLKKAEKTIGSETKTNMPKKVNYDVKWFFITNKRILNEHLKNLNLKQNFEAVITRIRRSGIDISPTPNTKLRFGDKVQISFQKDRLSELEKFLGNSLNKLNDISFIPVALGAALGIVLGLISFKIGIMEIKLGLTGGVLITSILLSNRGKTGPIIWTSTGSGNQLLRELGLLLFLAPIGISGGAKITSILYEYGYSIIMYSIMITLLIPTICTLLGLYLFKINVISFMGILSAGMTSTPSLGAIDSISSSNAHRVAYASTYPFALISVIFTSQILALLL